jgi:predicted glycosyltransferase
MQCTYKRNIKARSRNHCHRGKAISITYSECVFVALGIQHAKRMLHIIICSLTSSIIHFTHYLIKGSIFGGKFLKIKRVFYVQLLSEIFLIIRRI